MKERKTERECGWVFGECVGSTSLVRLYLCAWMREREGGGGGERRRGRRRERENKRVCMRVFVE